MTGSYNLPKQLNVEPIYPGTLCPERVGECVREEGEKSLAFKILHTLLSWECIVGNADQSYPDSAKIIHTSNYKVTQWGFAAPGGGVCYGWQGYLPSAFCKHAYVSSTEIRDMLTTCCSRYSAVH